MIKDFFENSEIFLTGGTGVVGKALIEKLLRSCNVRKMYVLIRPKKNASIEKRFEELKEDVIFCQLKVQKPDELDQKLMAIPGDASLPFLGITDEYKIFLENVSIIFHSAATVRFDEPLKVALKLNVGGTLETLKFAETLKHLQAFMHISTFFSNPYLEYVEEKVYDSPMDWRFCLNLLERDDISDELLDTLTKKLIVGFPNTYCFTKNLSESVVNDYRDKLPLAIYRPSIITYAIEEPVPGFTPTLIGANGLFVVTGAGIMKTICISKNSELDFTPQDLCVKSLSYYTVKTASLYENKKKLDKIPVFTTSSYKHSELTFIQITEILQNYGFWDEAAFEKSFLLPGLHPTDNRSLFLCLFWLKQILPAILLDFVLVLSGRKPVVMRIQRKLFLTLQVIEPFLFNNYRSLGITDANEMLTKLKGTEFYCEPLKNAKDFYKNLGYIQPMPYAVRKYLLKEDPKTLPRSRQIFKFKKLICNFTKLLLTFKLYQKSLDYIAYISSEKL